MIVFLLKERLSWLVKDWVFQQSRYKFYKLFYFCYDFISLFWWYFFSIIIYCIPYFPYVIKFIRIVAFFYNFFSEKTGIKDSFDITLDDGSFHIVETGVILEMIEKTKGTERKNIEMIIRKIDFQNGDVNHFLNHLAIGIATLYQTV